MGMDFRNQMGNTTRFSLFNTLSGLRYYQYNGIAVQELS